MRNFRKKIKYYLQALLIILALIFEFNYAQAETISEIQAKINKRNEDITALEKDIVNYQSQISSLGNQANSLSSTIKSLELNQKKLQADIQITENKIANRTAEIEELSKEIKGKEETIVDDNRIISYSLSMVDQMGNQSVIELLLSGKSVSTTWNSLDQLGNIQSSLVEKIENLREIKANLETNKKATEKAKTDLLVLNKQLKDQRQVVLNTQAEKNDLLKETKQNESLYKKMLAEKKAQKDEFEREVTEYEAQLKFAIDMSKLPKSGSSVLSWPLSKVIITQYFGDTAFATANPQIYHGKGHNGIDFGASIGTPVKSSASGVVIGMSNTDLIRGCYSYGKWIMVDHKNGLSTLYAHLSLQTVSVGQEVSRGEVIGYTGNTGYTTGPHLHYGVYATQGTKIQMLTTAQSIRCAGSVIPVAGFNAYMNPLSFIMSN